MRSLRSACLVAVLCLASPLTQGATTVRVEESSASLLYTGAWDRQNKASLPGGEAHDLRLLPDGGVLVSSGAVIARLDASGTLGRTYQVSGEYQPWTGLDLAGDGTFWAGNYESSNVYRFDLATGTVLSSFNTGTAAHTVVDVLVRK